MEGINFKYSTEMLKSRQKIIYLLMALMPIALGLFVLVLGVGRQGNLLSSPLFIGSMLGIAILLEVEMWVVGKWMISKVKKLQLYVTEDMVIRTDGKIQEQIVYGHIKELVAKYNPDGSLLQIKVSMDKKSINIIGFEKMEEILEHLNSKKNDGATLQIKKYKVDWNSPKTTAIVFAVTVVIILTMMIGSFELYNVFNKVFQLGFALWFLLFQPISKNAGIKFRKYEIALGGILMILGIVNMMGL